MHLHTDKLPGIGMNRRAKNVVQGVFPEHKVGNPLPQPQKIQRHGDILLDLKQLALELPIPLPCLQNQVHGGDGRFNLVGP